MLEGQNFEPAGRLAQFMRMVEAFERDEIETAVDGLISLLDARDGDTDMEDDERGAVLMRADGSDATFDGWRTSDAPPLLESDGDEDDGNRLEDDFCRHHNDGPGCPISDTAEENDPAEDDDPAEMDDEPEDENDREAVNEDGIEAPYALMPKYGVDQTKGPINAHSVHREHMARERGLERTAAGGWRHPAHNVLLEARS